MHIDPENREFTEIEEVGIDTPDDEFEAAHKRFVKAREAGHITATSYDIDNLRKLQDDLRRAGYKKVK